MIFCGQPPTKNSQGRNRGGKMKQKHDVQTKEINCSQVISDGKVIKESSQVP